MLFQQPVDQQQVLFGKEVITPEHEDWLRHHHNASYSPAALSYLQQQLANSPRLRTGTFSASAAGSCVRAQQFEFVGLSRAPLTPKQISILYNGTFMHYRWQLAGLTAGWLSGAEIPINDNAAGLIGTADGLHRDGGVVEFKSINAFGYSNIRTFGIKDRHRWQVQAYMYGLDQERALVIYENKDTQSWTEFNIERDQTMIDAIIRTTDQMWNMTHVGQLYEPKEKCIDQTGTEYHQCPYRHRCLDIKVMP
jgi:hypothetical protein